MNCPRYETLLKYVRQQIKLDCDLENHLKECERCSVRMWILEKFAGIDFDAQQSIRRHVSELQLYRFAKKQSRAAASLKHILCCDECAEDLFNIGTSIQEIDAITEPSFPDLTNPEVREKLDIFLKKYATSRRIDISARLPHIAADEDEIDIVLAADDVTEEDELEEIKRELGLKLAEKRLRFSFSEETTYWGWLEIDDLHNANLVFEKDGQETSDLDGVEIEFYNTDTPEKRLTERVEEDFVRLDFEQLNLSIRDYARVGFRLSFSSKKIEGILAEME